MKQRVVSNILIFSILLSGCVRTPVEYNKCVDYEFGNSTECKNRDSLECKKHLEYIEIKDPRQWCKRETMNEFYDKHPVLLVLSLPILIIVAPIAYLITGD